MTGIQKIDRDPSLASVSAVTLPALSEGVALELGMIFSPQIPTCKNKTTMIRILVSIIRNKKTLPSDYTISVLSEIYITDLAEISFGFSFFKQLFVT